ncbi:MAG: ABC transporter ATP-binding protein [Verrucomicrobiales bacterium]
MKRISRKDMADMSTSEIVKASTGPYKRLAGYLKPYKSRFILGILFGALAGLVNGGLVLTIRHVTGQVFPDKSGPAGQMITEGGGAETVVANPAARGQPLDGDFDNDGASNALELAKGTDLADALSKPEVVGLSAIAMTAMLVPAAMALRGLFSYLNAYCLTWVSLRVLSDIRTSLFRRILGQSLDFFGKKKGGDLIQTIFNQTRIAQMALTNASSDIIKQPISIISAVIAIFYIEIQAVQGFPWFSVGSLVLFPLCIAPVMYLGKKVRKSGGKEEEEAGMLMVVMQEAFAGIRVVKSQAREEYEQQKFEDANAKMMRFIMRWRKALEMVGPMVETVASVGVAAALVYVAMRELPAKDFLALQGGLVLLYPPAKALSRIHVMLQKCLAATTKVFELMDTPPKIQDKEDAKEIDVPNGEIVFDDVNHAYQKGINALEHFSLTIPPGKTYALVGETGAGKSTAFSLLLRFYDPYYGAIRIDGQDIRDVTQQSLRDNIGVVNQESFLFHDTIYENIRYGRLDATKAEIEAAAKKAHAHEFILEQPEGYQTVVGDKGCNLSGGQQQRISIARAILRDAPILLLDEAMASLDAETEKKVQEALDILCEGKTVLAIAHRLATILEADQIVVMAKGGVVVDIGTHLELLDRCDYYRRLYELQFRAPEPA